jgi:predicted transposase/invertase (TIGR01784 family)
LQERIFEEAFRTAEIAQFNQSEAREYEASLKYYRDLQNVVDTAIQEATAKAEAKGLQKGLEEGLEKGLEKGRDEKQREIARNLKRMGLPAADISNATGLSAGEIDTLQ